MKIYTKKGDTGTTSLASGSRVSKSDKRVELYGTADELNSSLGVALSFLRADSSLRPGLERIQNLLFELGSELAGFRKKDDTSCILEDDILSLEKEIDLWQESLVPLKNFILPGGSAPSSFLHISRTLARRLERDLVRYKEEGAEVFPENLRFLNRLSDYLFVAARFANFESKIEEPQWKSRAKGQQ
ncbi:cob(I)yrinic acid a,c-diamide adenosyltransferase [Leptospira wolffii]|uniref:Corrinoid adenosyltransferase n=1 Tax=Leptospira wolffii TaxID=409998 RepID=A0ABV5BPR0_9LEPT|nr:cob(I)yrinic acid a,c-diamide adenosyltransferase [Leptospira wolffii]EPG66864.1 ATP:cob(I)alamin adenosyltransferase [Leptospira wolffii serovar Khorat str. Khorat-H2]TGL53780.1 cob(I)yrinic acid a,c-diamide adenosyltransferase [Leptospira wolffii]